MTIVAHIDILGMSTLVENNFQEAWGMLSDLVAVRDRVRSHEYEFITTNERLSVLNEINIVTFSDTLFLFTSGASDIELKSMIILVAEIFHAALFKCVPVRAGIALGEFRFNLEKSMFAGPALIEACRVGESAKWLGITLSDTAQGMATNLGMKSNGRDVITHWPVPIENGERPGFVVNWPAVYAHDLAVKPPVSVRQFYQAFETAFGSFDTLQPAVQAKYENTVNFMNGQLMLHSKE